MPGLVESTVYRVETVYDVTDRASNALAGIKKEAAGAAESTQRLSTALLGVGSALLASRGIGMGKKAFIDFNATVQDTKNTIAGMMALATKTDLVDNLARADRLYANLQRRAATLPGTTAEYVQMAGMITQPIMDAGLRMKDLENLTVAAVVGAKALRVDAGAAARDIDQALRGQYHSVDVFTGKLLGAMGYAGEAGRKRFNALDPTTRASELMKGVDVKQIQQLAQAQGATFSGVLSTLQDKIEIVGGKIGKPLFEAVTKEIKEWVSWLDKNDAKLNDMARTVGGVLVDGFKTIKTAAQFIVEHADTLMTIGKIWAGVKIGGMLGSALAGSIGGLGGMGLGKSVFGKGGIGLAGAAGPAGMALAGGYMLGNAIMGDTGEGGLYDNLRSIFDSHQVQLDQEFIGLERSTKKLADSITKAADQFKEMKDSRGTQQFANMEGLINMKKVQQNVLADIAAGRYEGAGTIMGAGTRLKLLRDAGFTEEDVKRYGMGDSRSNAFARGRADFLGTEISNLTNRQNRAGIQTDTAVAAAMRSMTDDQKQSVDVAKGTQKVMLEMVRLLAEGKGPLTVEQVKKLLLDSTSIDNFRGQAKPNVTNIKIDRVEVAAKDPDRWIAELDAKARSHRKAPRGARSSIQGLP